MNGICQKIFAKCKVYFASRMSKLRITLVLFSVFTLFSTYKAPINAATTFRSVIGAIGLFFVIVRYSSTDSFIKGVISFFAHGALFYCGAKLFLAGQPNYLTNVNGSVSLTIGILLFIYTFVVLLSWLFKSIFEIIKDLSIKMFNKQNSTVLSIEKMSAFVLSIVTTLSALYAFIKLFTPTF